MVVKIITNILLLLLSLLPHGHWSHDLLIHQTSAGHILGAMLGTACLDSANSSIYLPRHANGILVQYDNCCNGGITGYFGKI